MVLKKSKHGLNTGNTLRSGTHYLYRQNCMGAEVDTTITVYDPLKAEEILMQLQEDLQDDYYVQDTRKQKVSLNKGKGWCFLNRLQDWKSRTTPFFWGNPFLSTESQWVDQSSIDVTILECKSNGQFDFRAWHLHPETVKGPKRNSKGLCSSRQNVRGVQRKLGFPIDSHYGKRSLGLPPQLRNLCQQEEGEYEDEDKNEDEEEDEEEDGEEATYSQKQKKEESWNQFNHKAAEVTFEVTSQAEPLQYPAFRTKAYDEQTWDTQKAKSKTKGQKNKNRGHWKGLRQDEEQQYIDELYNTFKRKKNIRKAETNPEKLGFVGPYSKSKKPRRKSRSNANMDGTLDAISNLKSRPNETEAKENDKVVAKEAKDQERHLLGVNTYPWLLIELLACHVRNHRKVHLMNCDNKCCCQIGIHDHKPAVGTAPSQIAQGLGVGTLESRKQIVPSPPKNGKPNKGVPFHHRNRRVYNPVTPTENGVSGLCDTNDKSKLQSRKPKVKLPGSDIKANGASSLPNGPSPTDSVYAIDNLFITSPTGSQSPTELMVATEPLEDHHTLMQLKIKSSTLKSSSLVAKHGKNYWEGRCWPRRFCIDISEDVQVMFGNHQSSGQQLGILAVILVQCDMDCHDRTIIVDNRAAELVSVEVKADLETSNLKALQEYLTEELKPFPIYTLHKMVNIIVGCFKRFPPASLRRYDVPSVVSRPADVSHRSSLSWLSSLCNWQVDIYTAAEARNIWRQQNGSKHHGVSVRELAHSHSSKDRSQVSTPKAINGTCELCGERWLLEGTDVAGVMLKACGHSICHGCFDKALKKCQSSALQRDALPVKCPMKQCSEVVDTVSLLSILSVQELKHHLQAVEDIRLEQHPQWQWCPNRGCGRAVRVAATDLLDVSVSVECLCAHSWCFFCQQRVHWPATCQQAKVFRHWQAKQGGPDDTLYRVKYLQCAVCSACKEIQLTNLSSCTCEYLVCVSCLNLEACPWNIPKVPQESLSMESARPLLLPILFYRSAINYDTLWQRWNHNQVQTKAAMLTRMIQKLRNRLPSLMSNSVAGRSGALSRALTQMSITNDVMARSSWLTPSSGEQGVISPRSITRGPLGGLISRNFEVENLFLNTAFQFIHQTHFLLSYGYAVLCQLSPSEVNTAVVRQMVKLEAIVQSMDLILSQSSDSPSTILPRLKTAMESGNKITSKLVLNFRQLQGKF